MKILHFFECCPMCLLQMGALRKDHSEFLHQNYQSTPNNLFSQGVTWKRGGVMDTSYFWGNSDCTQGEHFSKWEQPAIGIISSSKVRDSPVLDTLKIQLGRVLDHFIYPIFFQCFCQESLNQIIPEAPLHPPILSMQITF